MKFLPQLFESNRAWAREQVASDPKFFDKLCAIHNPEHLWIGCSDSRVPANQIVGLAPGEMFVHRNIANAVSPDDPNCMAVIQYAIHTLGVEHIIVCGHYGCGGVQAALGPPLQGHLEMWLAHVRAVREQHRAELDALPDATAQWHRLCELNVMEQVATVCRVPTVQEAWHRGKPVIVHGWIYDLADGLLRDLDVSVRFGQDI